MVNYSKRAFLKYLSLSILSILLYFSGKRGVGVPLVEKKEKKEKIGGDESVQIVVEDGALVVK